MNEVVRVLRRDNCFVFDVDQWHAMCRSSWGDLLWGSYQKLFKDCKTRAEDAKDEKVEEYLH